jgi:two-component system sensor histidine kinase HydH
MRILQLKKMYLPAVSIMTVVLLLLVLIGISTYRNLDREKKRTLDFVHRQGLALLRSLEAGARAGMMMPMWHEDAVGDLIKETAKSEDIAYIYLLDKEGGIIHNSDHSHGGRNKIWKPVLVDENQVEGRVRTTADRSQVYELAKRYSPLSSHSKVPGHQNMMDTGRTMALDMHPGAVVVLGLMPSAPTCTMP